MQFRNQFAFLSNMYPCTIAMPDGFTYRCAEAAFQAQKTNDPSEKLRFTSLSGPDAKRLGRRIKLRPDWNECRVTAMRQVIDAKFRNPVLAEQLKTVSGEIVEDNTWNDRFWGRCNGTGENRLGILLMEKRDTLLSHEATTC